MPIQEVSRKVDHGRHPHVIQEYKVPVPKSDRFKKHDQAVFSMWMHFVDFCLKENQIAQDAKKVDLSLTSKDELMGVRNKHTQEERLFVFIELALGREPSPVNHVNIAKTALYNKLNEIERQVMNWILNERS